MSKRSHKILFYDVIKISTQLNAIINVSEHGSGTTVDQWHRGM